MSNVPEQWRGPVVATALAALLATAHAAGGEEFGLWNGSCDERQHCTLETTQFDGGPSKNLLVFSRGHHEPHWRFILRTGASGPIPDGLTVSVDGLDFRFAEDDIAVREHQLPGANYRTELVLGGPHAQSVLDELQLLGDRVKVTFRDGRSRNHVAHFWIPTFTDALAWVGRQQGREGEPHTAEGGSRALVTHSTPAAAVPPEVLELRDSLEHCQPLEDLQHGEHLIAADDLGDTTALYVLPCSGGGFNLSYVVYHDTGGEISPRWLVDYSHEESWFATPDLFNVEWDAGEKVLRTFRKGRSIGDCGSVGEWRYGDMGLRLERMSYQGDCDGTVPPGEFPAIFEAKPAAICVVGDRCE